MQQKISRGNGSGILISQLPRPFFIITPFGEAVCHFINDVENDVIYGCIQTKTNEIWWWRNEEVRYDKHITEGLTNPSPIVLSKERQAALAPHMKRYKK